MRTMLFITSCALLINSVQLLAQPQPQSIPETVKQLRNLDPDKTKITVFTKDEFAKAKAAGVTTNASEIAQNLKTDPPKVNIEGNSGTGGGADSSVTAITKLSGPQVGRIILSVVCICSILLCLYTLVFIKPPQIINAIKYGSIALFSGLCLLIPEVAQVILGFVCLIFLIDGFFGSNIFAKLKDSLTKLESANAGIVHGIAEAEKDPHVVEPLNKIKGFIKAQTDETDRALIKKVRAAGGYSND